MSLLRSTFYMAQTYGCGTYGQAAYDQCVQQSAPPTQQSSPTDQSQLQQTATPEQSGDFLEPSQPQATQQQQNRAQPEAVGPMSGIGFEWLLLIAFLVALLIALIIFWLKRRKRKQLDQSSEPTDFTST